LPTPIVTDVSQDRREAAPRVVLPDPTALFADRALRFGQLANDHPMGDFLQLMGRIAQAQQVIAGTRRPPPVNPTALAHSRDHAMPPLAALAHARDPQWRDDLRDLLGEVAATGAAAATLAGVSALDASALESLADRILAATTLDADAAAVPLVGAALQVYFARLAASLDVASVSGFDLASVCPVCATRPVASIVRLGGERNNLRYLACALCQTEWNVPRITCTACATDRGVHYLSLQSGADDLEPSAQSIGVEAARRAEACDECKSYLKIFYQEKDPLVDPLADDLASLALDVLVDERGYGRSGPNLLFHPGSA